MMWLMIIPWFVYSEHRGARRTDGRTDGWKDGIAMAWERSSNS